uniref:Metalloendopeptidase n=1 Tax=Lates calcarifer TaxID=8187 RepID=A0A4W6EQX9_LATCA
SISTLLERANANVGEPLVMYGDIAVPTGLGNADPCTEQGCLQFCKERSIIIKGLRSFAQSTCIRFTPLNRQRDFVNIQSLSGCFSYVGRQGRNQTHELLHALGFNHEQTRSDSSFNNAFHNFRKIQTRNLGTPYDYNSVMHYGRYPTDILRINRLYQCSMYLLHNCLPAVLTD